MIKMMIMFICTSICVDIQTCVLDHDDLVSKGVHGPVEE